MGNIGLEPEITREFLDKEYRRACELIATQVAHIAELEAEVGRLREDHEHAVGISRWQWDAQCHRAEKAEARIAELEAMRERARLRSAGQPDNTTITPASGVDWREK